MAGTFWEKEVLTHRKVLRAFREPTGSLQEGIDFVGMPRPKKRF